MCIIQHLITLIDSPSFLVLGEFIAILVNIAATLTLLYQNSQDLIFLSRTKPLLATILIASIAEDLAWMISVLEHTVPNLIDHRLVVLIIRLSWLLLVFQYQSFSMFIEQLTPNQSKLLLIINRIFLIISTIYTALFSYLILTQSLSTVRPSIELAIFNTISRVYIPAMVLTCLIYMLTMLSNRGLPPILRKIFYIFTSGLIGPTILIDAMHIYQPSQVMQWLGDCYAAIGLSSILMATIFYASIKQMLDLDHTKNKSAESDYI